MKTSWVAVVLGLHQFAMGKGAAQTSPCSVNPDSGAMHVAFLTRQVTLGDSARLAQQGLPYRPPAGVAIVSDTTICRAVTTSYNALDSITATNVGQAYVMKVGTTPYAMVGDKSGNVYFVFDTAYHVLGGVVPMN